MGESEKRASGLIFQSLVSRCIQLLPLLVGLVSFAIFSGFSSLSPTSLGWVMNNFDTPTHYLGWQFFRQAPWDQWPWGMNALYGFDAPGSIVLSDSIPLMALLFKPVAQLLPADFQYFGLWLLACFLLQAWFSSKLLQKFSSSILFCLAGTFFFTTATVFLVKLYMHPALAGQWLILAAMCLHFSTRFRSGRWLALLLLASLVHAYLLLMVGAIWGADILQRMYRREFTVAVLARHAAIGVALTALMLWWAGYFLPISVQTVAFRANANLLFPFWTGENAYGSSWSAFLPGFEMGPKPPTGEGFCYLGLGFLLLLSVFLPLRTKPRVTPGVFPRSAWLSLSAVCFAMLVFALGNTIYAGDKIVLAYSAPAWFDTLQGIFRAGGRFIWPIWYLMLLIALYRLSGILSVRNAGLVACALLAIQLADLSKPMKDYRTSFETRPEWRGELRSPAWKELAGNYSRIVFIAGAENAPPLAANPFLLINNPGYKQVARFAAIHGLGINTAYLARFDEPKAIADRNRRLRALSEGRFEPGTLYVVTDAGLQRRAGCASPDQAWIGRIDGIDLVVPGGQWLPALATLAEASCLPG